MLNLGPADGLFSAVFLDRHRTLVEDRGHMRHVGEVFLRRNRARVRRLQTHFCLFIVINQSGVDKGELALAEANRINNYAVGWLQERSVAIAAVCGCPHRRDQNCVCIKPKPFFLEQTARQHNPDLRRSFTVGDHPHDVELARNAGATGIYVLTGRGEKHRAELGGEVIVHRHIGEAADWILSGAYAPDSAAGRQQRPPAKALFASPTLTVVLLCR